MIALQITSLSAHFCPGAFFFTYSISGWRGNRGGRIHGGQEANDHYSRGG